ncbi:MAG: type IV secretory system conjugative DNA transfer family protein [Actinobacteria bacterium]|nr:type IV secretory system conjugative DNA transfer family protein [Actinomycetota bacterium]
MNAPPSRNSQLSGGHNIATGLSPFELVVAFGLGVAVAGSAWLWAAAQLAALVTSGSWLTIRLSEMVPVAFEVARHPGDPRAAFPVEAASRLPGPVLFWTAASLLLVAVLVPVWWLLGRRARRQPEASDASRWATPQDLTPLVVPGPVPGRLTLGYGSRGRLLATEAGHSLLVLGPTQSGKTSGLAIPAILEWPGPVVATSVKADLLAETISTRRDRGDVWVYDPTSSVAEFDSASWTPLAGCHSWQEALRTASWLTQAARDRQLDENDFWYSNAGKLIAPLLFAAATSGCTISDVVRWVDLKEQQEVELLLKVARVPEALAAARASWGREERSRSSVYTTAETVLAAFADPQVAASAQRSDIDPERLLGGGAHTLYVSAPLHEQARLRPLFTALVQTVLAAAYERAGSKGRLNLLLVLDEAANIAPLRELAQVASTAAGLGIQLVTIWQDRSQIVARYGHQAATVVNNHRAKLLLSGITDATTTTEVAQVIGEAEVTRRTTTVDPEGRISATHATQHEPLTSAAGLRQMRPFEGVLIYGHLPPTRIRLKPWFDAPKRWRERPRSR